MELNQFRDVDIVLDKANDNIIQKQFVSAGDKDGRSLTVQITENGVIGEVAGATLNLYWHNEVSGLTDLSAFYVVDKATSVFKIDYPQNMLTPGKVIAYIQIMHGGKVTHTKPFEITVQNLAGTTRGVLATAEYSALVTTLAKANEFETEIAKKADKTQVDALGNEIILARGGAQTLGERLDSSDTRLGSSESRLNSSETRLNSNETRLNSNESDIADLHSGKIDKTGNGQVNYANLAQDIRSILAGDRVPIVEDDSIITTNLTNSAVTPVKTTFFENTGKNLFDKNNVTRGKYANYLTGELIATGSFGVSDYIPILPGIFYAKSNTQQIPFFDENKNIIPGIDGQTRFQTPVNARYVRFNFLLSEIDSAQLELGRNATNYEPYQPKIKDIHITDSDKVVKKVLGKNLFDKSKAVKDRYIAFDNGSSTTSSGYYASDYIPLEALSAYTKNNINQFAFYDRYKQYLSGLTDGTKTFTTPENTEYGRFTLRVEDLNNFQLEKGSQFTGFEEYGYRLPSAVSNSAKGFVVVGLEKGDYNSIQDAYDQTVGDVVIVVLQGIYFESLKFKDNTRKVSLLGVDRENCIVQDNSGDYNKAPLDAKPNLYVENMTFISTHTDNTPYNIPSYAVHLDSGGSGTAYFKNCKMVSYQNSAVGIGTHQDQTIILDNCEIVKISDYDGGALYMHNAQASDVTNQKVITKNCLIKTTIGFAIKVDDANTYTSGTNSPMDITFQFNILDSGTRGKDQRVLYRDSPINGGVSGQIKLTSDSFGNNDVKLNA